MSAKLNMLDRLAGAISPAWGLRRGLARARLAALSRAHEGAYPEGAPDWLRRRRAESRSADQANLPDAAALRARARDAVSNDWLAASMAGANERDVVHVGITPRASATGPGGEALEAFNREADRRFKRWAAKPRLVDVEGRKTFRGFQLLAQSEKFVSGNAFLVMGRAQRRNAPSLTLQMFESEQLAEDHECRPAAGHEVRGGVEVDRNGKPVAYWVHTGRHPLEGPADYFHPRPRMRPRMRPRTRGGNPSGGAKRIPARRVLHLHRQGRVRETVGVSRLAPVLRQMADIKGYEDNERVAKRKEAFAAFGIKMNPLYGDGGLGMFDPKTGAMAGAGGGASGEDVDRGAGDYRELDFTDGRVPVLYDGEELQFFDPSRPGSNYDAYMRRQTNAVSAAVGRAPSAVTRDYNVGSYSAARQGLVDDHKHIDGEQLDLIEHVLLPIWERFILLEVLEGKLSAPGFFDDPGGGGGEAMERYLGVEWGLPPRPWIDPAKSAAAAKIQLDYRLATRRDIANEDNADWREQLDQIGLEREYAEARGIELPEDNFAGGFGPPRNPSEPKVHGGGKGAGDSSGGGAGEAPRTQGRGADRLAEAILADAVRAE